jgi:RsiW-degrading membrane proteinase PrsW (M82 family)
MQLTIAFLIATTIPLICLGIIYTRNLYSTSQIKSVALCFGWGLISFLIAAQINTFIMLEARIDSRTLGRYIAPITEEIIKAAFLIYLARRRSFNYFVDGAIYGFAIGIGFAVVENYRYITNYPVNALAIAAGRVLSTNLIHATGSAIIGVMLGLTRFQKDIFRRVLFFGAGLALAILIHGGFNNIVSSAGADPRLIYLYAILIGFSGAAFIMWLIHLGLKEERGWIDEMLGVADQVTRGESRMVLRLAEAGVLLTPIVERFGKQKAAQIGRLLAVQAQLGILRKTAQTLPDERMRQDAEVQISALREEMALLRNRIGIYPMLYLRGIFPNEDYSVWARLEAATIKPADEENEIESKDFSLADMLQSLPIHQRQIMQAVLRGRKRIPRHELQTELTRASRERPLTEGEFAEAFNDLTRKRNLLPVKDMPDFYEANIRRKAGLTLSDNIWDRLSAHSFEANSSDANVWGDLKNLLMEQSKRQTKPGINLWVTLAQRIPE